MNGAEWTCAVCTLINNDVTVCAACNTPQGTSQLPPQPSAGPSSHVQEDSRHFAGLHSTILAPTSDIACDSAIVICHGLGANEQDLAPLGHAILASLPNRNVRAYFPRAPLVVAQAPGFPRCSWWPLDLPQIMGLFLSGQIDQMRNLVPEGIDAIRMTLRRYLFQIGEECGLPLKKIIIGGFSQGAMTIADVLMHLGEEEEPGAVVLMSGTVIAEGTWRDAPLRPGLKVLQSHGRQDPVLPFFSGTFLTEACEKRGMSVDFLPFDGAHTVPMDMLQRVVPLVEETCAREVAKGPAVYPGDDDGASAEVFAHEDEDNDLCGDDVGDLYD